MTIQALQKSGGTLASGFRWIAVVASLCLAVTTGCGIRADQGALDDNVDVPSPPLLRIDGKLVSKASFERFAGVPESDLEETELASLFREFVKFQVLVEAARASDVVVTQTEASATVQKWISGDEEPSAELISHVEEFLLVQKYLSRRLSAEDELNLQRLLQHYSDNADVFRVDDRLRVLEIVLDSEPEAEALLSRLDPGDFRQFREEAREHSVGVFAERGGEIGVFERGMLPERFEDVIFKLRVGELSSIVESSQGFHIFTVEELQPRHDQKFYEVNQAIFDELVMDQEREKLDEIIDAELARRKIEVLDRRFGRLWKDSGEI